MKFRIFSVTLVLVDVLLILLIPFLAMFIRLEGQIDSRYLGQILHILPLMLVIKIATYAIFGLYNRMWRYASIYEMLVVVGAVTTGSILTYGYIKLVEPSLHQ